MCQVVRALRAVIVYAEAEGKWSVQMPGVRVSQSEEICKKGEGSSGEGSWGPEQQKPACVHGFSYS